MGLATSFGPDVDVYVTIVTRPAEAKWDKLWLFARINPDDQSFGYYQGYGLWLDNSMGSYSQVAAKLVRIDSITSRTILATTTISIVDGSKVGLRCSGSSITAYHNTSGTWTQILSVSDSIYNSASTSAVGWRVPGNWFDEDTSNPGFYDDFGAGTISNPPATFPEAPVGDNFNRTTSFDDNEKWWTPYPYEAAPSQWWLPGDTIIVTNTASNGHFYDASNGGKRSWLFAASCDEDLGTPTTTLYAYTANPKPNYQAEIVIKDVGATGIIRMIDIWVRNSFWQSNSKLGLMADYYVTYFKPGANVEVDDPKCELFYTLSWISDVKAITNNQQPIDTAAYLAIPETLGGYQMVGDPTPLSVMVEQVLTNLNPPPLPIDKKLKYLLNVITET